MAPSSWAGISTIQIEAVSHPNRPRIQDPCRNSPGDEDGEDELLMLLLYSVNTSISPNKVLKPRTPRQRRKKALYSDPVIMGIIHHPASITEAKVAAQSTQSDPPSTWATRMPRRKVCGLMNMVNPPGPPLAATKWTFLLELLLLGHPDDAARHLLAVEAGKVSRADCSL